MTLKEAIINAEEVAEGCQLKAYDIERNDYKDLEECAAEHRQLAKWLKELKAVHDEIDDADDEDEIFIGYLRKKIRSANDVTH